MNELNPEETQRQDTSMGALDVISNNAKFPKIIQFSDLCRCGEEIWIAHSGAIYRLRRTKQDKLILTK